MSETTPSGKKTWLAWYLVSVLVVAAFLIVRRWGSAEGFWGYMDLVSLCIWQAVVWPLYLLMELAGK